ncbi:MAG: hypothetical protein IJK54_05560 [Clostridia bacterium]|nr:hypothetical protein [Clostridia bacterium]
MEQQSLQSLHQSIAEAIALLDFDRIWKGFRPLKFALYNETECCLDGRMIEKTIDFCANTSIVFQGETIAIWDVQEMLPIPVFASKLVHEMFHGFQDLCGWNCFPDETDALYRYRYDAENLSLRLRENELLADLMLQFDAQKYRTLLQSRKYRSERFPYEFLYETRAEEIEGSANYVEWQVLKQLDKTRAETLEEEMRRTVTDPKSFFPIRRSCYFSGAMTIHAMICAGEDLFTVKTRPAILPILENVPACAVSVDPALRKTVEDTVSAYLAESRDIVHTAVAENDVALEGPCELVSVNIYDARCLEGHITSRFFVLYQINGEQKMLEGNFVVKMRDAKTIETVYRWN